MNAKELADTLAEAGRLFRGEAPLAWTEDDERELADVQFTVDKLNGAHARLADLERRRRARVEFYLRALPIYGRAVKDYETLVQPAALAEDMIANADTIVAALLPFTKKS